MQGDRLSCGCTKHGNRKYSLEEAAYRHHYYYHAKTCNNNKWGSLEFDEWKTIVAKNCTTCGAPPTPRTTPNAPGITIYINGVDRINSDSGYTIHNVQPMCTWCNVAKAQLTTEEFVNRCKAVLDHRG